MNHKSSKNEAITHMTGAYSVDSVVGDAKAPYSENELKGPLAPQFLAELKHLKENKKVVVKKVNTLPLSEIINLGNQIKNNLAVTAPKKTAQPKVPKAGGSHKQPLIKRLLKLLPDKGLEVSGIGLSPPKGAKSISIPKSANTNKFCVYVQLFDPESKQNVSKGLISNNPESLKMALEQLYPGETTTINTYLTSWQTAKTNASTAKSTNNVTISATNTITTGIPTVAPVFANGIASPPAQSMSAMFSGVPKF